ncbi:iron(III) transport system substrate-binding protein [Hydrogenoanaerobacterium saccharovorans]|uniref:Iron(III) transport system substrate-binding protein n=1 Tax=Hydrogenoanaerobacterium saccharovorans TaxID=474960 RepID=A0A1H8BFT8_9FIRM|nr:extracellular solute-binding protein [Hydrogenoanaerobacterium saccharovorans]RPF47433.1 iron(III) transport system substrate-binding protein [Hydrogenoanaerobacterium saccharovorans]SEM81626.1 iron(III) transport system substrate-binding protein [Hydrogenoanaerobacterium saccharovorans]
MKKLLCAALAMLLVLGLSSCGKNKEEEVPVDMPEKAPINDVLTIYSPLPQELLDAAVAGFEEKTGIKTEVVCDSADALIQQLNTEKDTPKADVLFGAGAEVVHQFKTLFSAYESTESSFIDSKFASKNKLFTPLTPMPIVLMYNKEQTTRAPEGWATLINSSYNGWVAFANPEKSGTSYTALCVMAQTKETGPEYIEKLALNLDGKMLDGISDVYAKVAEGEFAAGITLESSVKKYLDAGYENLIGIAYPKEGTTAALEVSAIVEGAAHKEMAQQFVDYVSGEDFQKTLVQQFGLRTVRTDLSDPDGLTEKKDINFIDYNIEQAVSGRTELLKKFLDAEKKAAPNKEEPPKQ